LFLTRTDGTSEGAEERTGISVVITDNTDGLPTAENCTCRII
jgi:hypothetical protein